MELWGERSLGFMEGFAILKRLGFSNLEWKPRHFEILWKKKNEKGVSASKSQAPDLLLSPAPQLFPLWSIFPLQILEQEFLGFSTAAAKNWSKGAERKPVVTACLQECHGFWSALHHGFFQQADIFDSHAAAPTLKRGRAVAKMPSPWLSIPQAHTVVRSELCRGTKQQSAELCWFTSDEFWTEKCKDEIRSLTFCVPPHTLVVKYGTWRAGEQAVLTRGQRWHLNCSFRKGRQVEQSWKWVFPHSVRRKTKIQTEEGCVWRTERSRNWISYLSLAGNPKFKVRFRSEAGWA